MSRGAFKPLPDPLGPLAALLRGVEGVEDLDRLREGLWIHATTPRPPVGQTPHEVVHQQDKLVVRYYAPGAKVARRRTPIVLVPSMINRAYILDLEPERSLVAALAAVGHPTYLVDWGVPGPEDADEDVGYVLLELLDRAVCRVVRHARTRQALMLGYCLGGTLAAMYTALRPQRIAGLVALTAPVRFEDGGRFRDFVGPGVFDVDAALTSDGLVPVSVMKPAFQMLDPLGSWNKYIALQRASEKPARLYRSLVRERWLEENVPMAGAFAREYIRNAYQEDRLMNGSWVVRGETVDLARITCPLLMVISERDFNAPPASCEPLARLVSSERVRVERLDSGHIGVVVGRMGPEVFYPMLDGWAREVAP